MAPLLMLVPPDDESIGERLRSARGHRTQAQLADSIGVSPKTLRNWEADRHSPTVEGVKAIAKATGWPASYLFGIDDDSDDGDGPQGDPTGASPVTGGYWTELRVA
jgi:transcriptional regulator with XRE-family HTH domain